MSDTNIYDNLLASLRAEFVDEADDNINIIENLLENIRSGQETDDTASLNVILRAAHSLKGSSSVADFPLVALIMHRLEDYLNGVKELNTGYIDDIQVFMDKTRKYASIDIVQSSISTAELVRQLPDRHTKEAEDTATNMPIIEALMVIREKTAGMIFERELRAAGLRVTTVRSSFAAIEMAVRTQPNIIICSGIIDELSGVDLSSAIKSMPVTSKIPVCLLTSFDRNHRDLEGLGDDVYIIDKSNLKDDLHTVLGKYGLLA